MTDIKITLETLYDILRNEKKHEELQSLEDTFFIDVVSYLREKKILLDNKKDSEDPFSTGEKEKLEYELRSIKRILKEIFEKREKKMIDIALNKSRTGSDIIDTSSMLREEKKFYEDILETLDYHRRGVLLHLFKGELPNISELKHTSAFSSYQASGSQEENNFEIQKNEPESNETHHENELEQSDGEETENENQPETNEDMTKIKFTHAVPSFVWKDMKVYGPFDVGDVTKIFPEVAALLIRKGRAEEA